MNEGKLRKPACQKAQCIERRVQNAESRLDGPVAPVGAMPCRIKTPAVFPYFTSESLVQYEVSLKELTDSDVRGV
jgi:hypothetical protein